MTQHIFQRRRRCHPPSPIRTRRHPADILTPDRGGRPSSAAHASGRCGCFRRRDLVLDRLRALKRRIRAHADRHAAAPIRRRVKRMLRRREKKNKAKYGVWHILTSGCFNVLGRASGARDEMDRENWTWERVDYRRGRRTSASGSVEREDEGLIAVEGSRMVFSRESADERWRAYENTPTIPPNLPPQGGLFDQPVQSMGEMRSEQTRQAPVRPNQQPRMQPRSQPMKPNLNYNRSPSRKKGRNARSPRILGTIYEMVQRWSGLSQGSK